jgi:hypothetical protein
MAQVQVRDAALGYVGMRWLHFPLQAANKGLEGLTCVPRDGVTHLLGLCEGNLCQDGAAGRQPGGGRVQVFTEAQHWDHTGTIRLPDTLWFKDYSSIAVAGDRVAVLSQESSALWVGDFVPGTWELAGAGSVHRFPPGPDGRVAYCNVEGVSWVAPDQVVVVSDKAKLGQGPGCRAKDQSIHVFAIP